MLLLPALYVVLFLLALVCTGTAPALVWIAADGMELSEFQRIYFVEWSKRCSVVVKS